MAKKVPAGRTSKPKRSPSRRGAIGPPQPAAETSAPLVRTGDAADADTEPAEYEPSHQEIAEAAYHRFLHRGGVHGDAFRDWIEAERELRKRKR